MFYDQQFQNMAEENIFVHTDKIVGIMGINEIKIVLGEIFGPVAKSKINLISITEPDNEYLPENLTKGFSSKIELKFWDLEEDFGNYKVITNEQGQEIKDFILKNKDKPFLIHCAAGISRSAGVGCAVECLLNYDGDVYAYSTGHSDVKAHWRYSPNYTVFEKICKYPKENKNEKN